MCYNNNNYIELFVIEFFMYVRHCCTDMWVRSFQVCFVYTNNYYKRTIIIHYLHLTDKKMATAPPLLPEPLVSPPEAPGQSQVIVRPMLTTAAKNFKPLTNCKSILKPSKDKITREDLPVKGSRCFLLHGLLTDKECSHYVKECEKIGFSELSGLFPAEYRSNDRVLSINQELVDALWVRLEPFLTRREVVRVRPMGFGNEGTWKPFRLNECCKFGRYRYMHAIHV